MVQQSSSLKHDRVKSNSHEELPNIIDILPDDQSSMSASKSHQVLKSKYQIESDLRQNQYFKKALEKQLDCLGPSQDSLDQSSHSSEMLFKFNELKEALKTDYSFHFQMKNGIFIAQSQI